MKPFTTLGINSAISSSSFFAASQLGISSFWQMPIAMGTSAVLSELITGKSHDVCRAIGLMAPFLLGNSLNYGIELPIAHTVLIIGAGLGLAAIINERNTASMENTAIHR